MKFMTTNILISVSAITTGLNSLLYCEWRRNSNLYPINYWWLHHDGNANHELMSFIVSLVHSKYKRSSTIEVVKTFWVVEMYSCYKQPLMYPSVWNKYSLNLRSHIPWKMSSDQFFSYFLKIFCGDKLPFCGVTSTLCFGLQLTLPMGFKVRVDAPSLVLNVTCV